MFFGTACAAAAASTTAGTAATIPRETGTLQIIFARGVASPFSASVLQNFGIMLVVLEMLAIHFESITAVEFISST